MKFNRLLSFILIFIVSGCNTTMENKKTEPFLFDDRDINLAITSDIHYLSPELTDAGQAFSQFVSSGDGKQLPYIDEIVDAFVWTLNEEQPDILIVSGDLTTNGAKKSHEDLALKFEVIEKQGTQVLVIPGNHDLFNPYARAFREDKQHTTPYIDSNEFRQIYKNYGYDLASSKDKTTLSYLVPISPSLWVLMLDTNVYNDNIRRRYPAVEGYINKETQAWIEACALEATKSGAQLMTVMHHNLLDHSQWLNRGFTLENNEELLRLFKKHQMLLNFSGHIHVQDITVDDIKPYPSYDVASGALSVYPHRYGKINYQSNTGDIRYETKKIFVDEWAKASQQNNQEILDFENYSKAYFGRFAYDMTIDAYGESKVLTNQELERLAVSVKDLNLRYFAGTEHENEKDDELIENLKLLEVFPKGFLKPYVKSILEDQDIEDNNLYLQDEEW